jgi:integrase
MWPAIGSTPRNFSLFAHAEDPAHEVPPAGVFGRGKATPDPDHHRTGTGPGDHDRGVGRCAQGTISPYTYHYLFGLLAATGLRISEALALQCNDLVEDGLIVRNGKFGKQRLITAAIDPSGARSISRHPGKAWRHGQ